MFAKGATQEYFKHTVCGKSERNGHAACIPLSPTLPTAAVGPGILHVALNRSSASVTLSQLCLLCDSEIWTLRQLDKNGIRAAETKILRRKETK